jgi:hypothetical protein
VDELEQILYLAGQRKPLLSEFRMDDASGGSNISLTGNEKRQIEKKHDIRPGTDAWWKLWFSRPYLTGERPYES